MEDGGRVKVCGGGEDGGMVKVCGGGEDGGRVRVWWKAYMYMYVY